MKKLTQKNIEKCFSVLKEFIAEANSKNKEKNMAVLALDHLQHITAGIGTTTGDENNGGSQLEVNCIDRPRAA